jgi:indolepyruvate ferredoxin oxidoreductase beta subunit
MKRQAMSNNGMTRNVFLSGVGGQGTILASNILGQVLLNAGYDVKKAEVHGMAQRGGDVTTHFRFGQKVYSPLIKQGDVDYLISFELLEALRYINWVKPEGKIILNNYSILPPTVSLGKMEYPKDVERTFRKFFGKNVWIVNGSEIAKTIGNTQVANVVLIGALSNFFPELESGKWIDAIKGLLPARLHELNIKAFHEGKDALVI